VNSQETGRERAASGFLRVMAKGKVTMATANFPIQDSAEVLAGGDQRTKTLQNRRWGVLRLSFVRRSIVVVFSSDGLTYGSEQMGLMRHAGCLWWGGSGIRLMVLSAGFP
jgi:hypothetical protein